MLNETVINELNKYRQTTPVAKESGGILLGARRGPHLEVVDLTTPFPRDIRKRTFFDRRDSRHNGYALKKWATNQRKIDYLGEWHTHPECIPSPSSLDIKEWRKLIPPRNAQLVFLILGISDSWLGLGRTSGIKHCKPFNDPELPIVQRNFGAKI